MQSEVARMIEEIDVQTDTMMQGLYSLSQGGARHEIIHAKWTAIIGRYQQAIEQANPS